MKRGEYLSAPEIKDFMLWLEPRLDTAHSFDHAYRMRRPVRDWHCDSLYAAYGNYTWPFWYEHPVDNAKITGRSYQDSQNALAALSQGLRASIAQSDHAACRRYCRSVLQWGGVLFHNDQRLARLGEGICRYFQDARERFAADLPYDQYYDKALMMNAGFTKLYSLSMDNFIIYDGRVGAALGLLARLYCRERELNEVPDTLAFAWGKGRSARSCSAVKNRRDPSDNLYVFPQLSNPKRHTEHNVKANWLLQGILNDTTSRFSLLAPASRMRALEAALFMIGYCVNPPQTSGRPVTLPAESKSF